MTSLETKLHNERIVSSFTTNGEELRYVKV